MIKYLFTHNDLIGSKLISSATKHSFQKTKDTPSHSAILFNDRWVFHSNFANGCYIEPYYSFKKKNKIVEAFRYNNCDISHTECTLLQDDLITKVYGSKYDWFAIAYFIYRIILKKLFGMPIPEKNKWEVADRWFCNEIFELKLGYDCSMKTPNEVMLALMEHEDFQPCEVFQ